ncbi:MAG: transcriptional repressor [Anaerolineae bacterium]|nr:transcriptional repressor [Anaerolineae bacterium]
MSTVQDSQDGHTHDHLDQDKAIIAVFRQNGHRVTTQRLAMLNMMRAQGGFLDAEELHDLVNKQGATLSLATVYRTLALFKEMNLVEGRIVGADQEREEYRFRSQQQHYSLTCRRCGAIVPVEPDIVDAFRQEVTDSLGVTVLTAHACFVGYCENCTAALAQQTLANNA